MALERNEKQEPQQPAPVAPEPAAPPSLAHGGPDFSAGRRFSVGVNVAVMVFAAAALLVALNIISYFKNFHRDLSTLGRYSMSDRTRRVVENIDQPVRLTILYDNSQDPEKDRSKYQPRVYDLAEEIKSVGKNVTVEDISTPDGRSRFAARIERNRGASAGDYRALVADFQDRQRELKKELAAEQARLGELVNDDKSWVRSFVQVQRAYNVLDELNADLDKTAEGIGEQGTGGLLVAYDKQTDLIKKFIEPALDAVKAIQKDVDNLAQLARKVKGGDGGATAKTKDLTGKVDQEFKAALALLAAKGPTSQPEQAKQLSQLAAALRKIAGQMNEESKLLTAFAEDQPAVRGMPGWNPQVQTEIMPVRVPLEKFFGVVGAELQRSAGDVEALSGKYTPETIKGNLPGLVEMITALREQAQSLFTGVLSAVESMGNVDARSQKLLDQGAAYLAPLSKVLEEFKTRLGKLPELKGSGLAEKLKGDNLLVVEVGEAEPRVLDFSEVWPQVAESNPMGKKQEIRRTFNGDSAIGSALLSASQAPLAEVVFVHYAAPVPPQMRMQQPPDEGDLPLSQMTVLRGRLEKANLKVTEWNLASAAEPPPPAYADQNEKAKPTTQPTTAPERIALPRVYVVLPPPPPASMMGEEARGFGPEQMHALADAIKDGGRAIFLACFSMPQSAYPGAPPMPAPYGWNEYLGSEWGLTVQTDYRLIQGVPDPREEGKFGLTQDRLFWMNLNSFTEGNPIGEPLRARRVLLTDVSPVQITDKDRPPGVSYQTVLNVPMSNRTIWATRDIANLVYQLRNESKVTVKPSAAGDLLPPLAVMVEATREPGEGHKAQTEIVVFGGGRSLSDFYLQQQVLRTGEENQVIFDPPPEVNAEIAINSIYWLAGQSKWIASGPIVIPPIKVPEAKLLTIQAMVIGIWPALVLVIGCAIWMYRRSH